MIENPKVGERVRLIDPKYRNNYGDYMPVGSEGEIAKVNPSDTILLIRWDAMPAETHSTFLHRVERIVPALIANKGTIDAVVDLLTGYGATVAQTMAIMQKQLDDFAVENDVLRREAQTRALLQPFNGLSPAEAERLAMLAEECGEVVQAVTKVLRYGWNSSFPNGYVSSANRNDLQRELGDLYEVAKLMMDRGDVNKAVIADHAERKHDNMRRYTHHQTFEPEVRADDH